MKTVSASSTRFLRTLLRGLSVALCLVHAPASAAPTAGDKAPTFAGRTADGQPVLTSAYEGKVVVLSFWASWCPPCRKELPILEGIQRASKGRVQVIAINTESQDVFEKIAPKMTSLAVLISSDAGHRAQKTYGVHGIPHMVIIGKDGQIVRVHRGYSEDGVDDVIKDLNDALTY